MNKKILAMAAMTSILVSGCSIQIGGGSDSPSKSNVVYDCSVLSDEAQKQLTKRTNQCTKGLNSDIRKCRDQAISSACKPVVSNNKVTN